MRRRQAGIPASRISAARPAPNGGREPLVRRIARATARACFPNVTVTANELAALETAVKAGALRADIYRLSDGWLRWATHLELAAAPRRVLRRLADRNWAARPVDQWKPGGQREPDGDVSEDHGDVPGAGSGSGRPRNWTTVPPGDDGNPFARVFEILPAARRLAVYRALARTLHPDVGGTDGLMRLLNLAYHGSTAPDGPESP